MSKRESVPFEQTALGAFKAALQKMLDDITDLQRRVEVLEALNSYERKPPMDTDDL